MHARVVGTLPSPARCQQRGNTGMQFSANALVADFLTMIEEKIELSLRVLLHPSLLLRYVWRKVPIGSIELREKFDAYPKSSYAWGITQAAKLAKSLGLKSMSVIEFGVAGGAGLLQMEKIALEAEERYGVKIEVYGFDSGVGLPKVEDFRDMPYVWKFGDFPMDGPDELRKRLKRAKLLIGDVRDTLKDFFKKYNPAPIGFISFDFDIYSSTKEALSLFEIDDGHVLPRVFCYFDDVMGDDAYCNRFIGELLAIEEFNEANPNQKVAKINGFAGHRFIEAGWNEGAYMFHRFNHKDYNRYLGPVKPSPLPRPK